MTILRDYQHFAGRHYETGTVHNALAYQGIKAPHTGEAVSEALLLGISGGVTFGYFTFEYEGYPPHIALLTRNTFDPLDTLLDRLAIPREILRTDKPAKGAANLLEALESGRPALIWADMFTLPYNNLPADERAWGMLPLLAYGLEDGTAYLADRSARHFTVPAEVLQKARGRVKKDEFRVMILDAPDFSRLSSAVTQGIWQAISLFTEAPPKGKRDNFGFAALTHWATMLTNTRNKHSWARYFPRGERLWMALAGNHVQPGAFTWLRYGTGNSAERGMYADFLDEAALILNKAGLKDAAALFRQSQGEWFTLTERLLPEDVPLLAEAKTLLLRKRTAFIEEGQAAQAEIAQINARLGELKTAAVADFPMDEAQVTAFYERLARQVKRVHDVEREAVLCLQSVMV